MKKQLGEKQLKNKGRKTHKIHWRGKVLNHGEAIDVVRNPGDTVLIERGRPRSLVCMCPCGCNSPITLNLDRRTGKAWILYQRKRGVSLYPSVWRDSGCESHFVIWNNKVFWLEEDWWFEEADLEELGERILPLVQQDNFTHFRELAESLEEVPWSVLRACKKLERKGILVEGNDDLSGSFRRL
ncbi:MAG: DUF6527 family protein [Bacteroidota bacterium]